MSLDKNNRFKVLLVEDNEDDATWTIDALTADGRCAVTRAGDGEQALEMLHKKGELGERTSLNFMLLDLTLPKKGGLDVLREMRKSNNPELKTLPVVIMTASTNFGDAKEALNLQVTTYLSKPVKLAELVEAVSRLIPHPNLSPKQREDLEAWARECGYRKD